MMALVSEEKKGQSHVSKYNPYNVKLKKQVYFGGFYDTKIIHR